MNIFVAAVAQIVIIIAIIGENHASQKERIEEIAQRFDTNSDGVITKVEFGVAATGTAGKNIPDKAWYDVVAKGDTDKDGKVSISEIVNYTITIGGVSGAKEKAIDMADTDQDGFISKEELENLSGHSIEDKFWKLGLKKADKNGDGKIDMEEVKCINPNFRELCISAATSIKMAAPLLTWITFARIFF